MTQQSLPWILFCAAAAGSLWLWERCLRTARRGDIARAQCETARKNEASARRTLQLFAQELKAVAASLRGHADRLTAERHEHAPLMAASAAQLGGLADELCHHLIPHGQQPVLQWEALVLSTLLEDAIRSVEAAIVPGVRHFRVRAGPSVPVSILADHRAMRLVLSRVLDEAVRSSSHEDWIDIDYSASSSGVTIRIEDEGAGAALASGGHTVIDSRGIGLRLALARSLTDAHGGTLEVESQARVGTRVTITLPGVRILSSDAG
jgi:signal transduction histidine kinase